MIKQAIRDPPDADISVLVLFLKRFSDVQLFWVFFEANV